MKPITYWVQNDAINQLVYEYGAHLEKLTLTTRRDLIAGLANGSHEGADDDYDLDQIYPLIEDLTRHEKDLLIEAIAATLTHQCNPWLENARKNVAIAQAHAQQKEGTPTH